MKTGRVTLVIPNQNGLDWFTEYEVDFGRITARLYETQLRLIDPMKDHSSTL